MTMKVILSLNTMSLFCEDLRAVKDFVCCKICHRKADNGVLDLLTVKACIDDVTFLITGCCESGINNIDLNQLGPAIDHRSKVVAEAAMMLDRVKEEGGWRCSDLVFPGRKSDERSSSDDKTATETKTDE